MHLNCCHYRNSESIHAALLCFSLISTFQYTKSGLISVCFLPRTIAVCTIFRMRKNSFDMIRVRHNFLEPNPHPIHIQFSAKKQLFIRNRKFCGYISHLSGKLSNWQFVPSQCSSFTAVWSLLLAPNWIFVLWSYTILNTFFLQQFSNEHPEEATKFQSNITAAIKFITRTWCNWWWHESNAVLLFCWFL